MIELMKILFSDLRDIFTTEAKLTAEEKQTLEMSEAIIRENWTKVRQIGKRDNLTPGELFQRVADGACHVWAAHREPRRAKEWTAIINMLELMDYEDYAEATDIRGEISENGSPVKG